MTNGNDKSLESWIWDAACSIRGAKDAPKFKDYILAYAQEIGWLTRDSRRSTGR